MKVGVVRVVSHTDDNGDYFRRNALRVIFFWCLEQLQGCLNSYESLRARKGVEAWISDKED